MEKTIRDEAVLFNSKTKGRNKGRKKRKKLNKKIKFQKKVAYCKNFVKNSLLTSLLFIIVALSTCLIIMQTKEANLVKNLYRDPLIPNSMVERVIEHLN